MAKFTVKVRLNNHKLSVKSMRQKAYRQRADEIVWYCPDARMLVDFRPPKGPTPFAWTHKDIPQNDTTPYQVINPVNIVPYTLTVYHPDYTVTIDPEVEIDDGDPGGNRKSARKKASRKSARKSARKPARKTRKK